MVKIRQIKKHQKKKENWNEVRFINQEYGCKMGNQI